MARKLVQLAALTCDECDKHGIPDVDADTTHTISIDGGPPKRFDFCPRSEKAIQFVLDLYETHGVEVPTDPDPKPAKKRRSKAVAKKEGAKALPQESVQKASEEPTEAEPPKEELRLWCPREHASQRGAGMWMKYRDRNSHAEILHKGARIWEIEWEDRHGVLTHPCTAHAECMNVSLAFASAQGVAQHIKACPLPRIDVPPTDEARP
jgi:hypothetical protein